MTVHERTEIATLRSDAALAEFVAEHYDRLLRLAWLVCRDTGDAADALQIGLEQAWRKRSTLRDEALLGSWLDRIVTREAVRVSKRRRSWLGRILSPRAEVTWTDPVDTRATEPSTFMSLRAAFNQLSPEQRAVVALHLHLGYTIAETASIVGAPDERFARDCARPGNDSATTSRSLGHDRPHA